ncbi:MAG: type II toxin-antitoxin system YafQ family toxin [Deltaproteobacteria bacterium]|nr:type II toxin-antitoxin system YafQ family toxin [Deltaproteobacteria bacterium]
MRRIEWTTAFNRDFKKVGSLESAFVEALWKLANDEPLPERFRDHELKGEWKGFRDCHIRPDLILVYRKPSADRLQLVRLGSHSELGF